MQGSLGEKIGGGVSADVHVWAPGQVVKLFKAGFPGRTGRWEARMTRAVFAAGAPAPEVLDEVMLEGRFGIVLRRLDGPTLLQHARSGAVTPQQAGVILATLMMSVHETPPPPEVFSLRDWMDGTLRLSSVFPAHIATDILTLIERLPPEDGLCHVDVHSANVIMTADGPIFIDWISAVRAGAGLDLACCHLLHSELIPETTDDPERSRAVNAAAQSEYARLAGISPAALTAAMEPYLPIVRVFTLLGPAGSRALRERLMQSVEATLHSEDCMR